MDIIIIKIVFLPRDGSDGKQVALPVYGNCYAVDIMSCYMEMTADI